MMDCGCWVKAGCLDAVWWMLDGVRCWIVDVWGIMWVRGYVPWLQVSDLCIWLNENHCPRTVLLLFGNGIRDEDERGVVG